MTDLQAKKMSLVILNQRGPYNFGLWVWPIIRNMPPLSLADLITAADPMSEPPDFLERIPLLRTHLFYMDYCYVSDTWYKRLWYHVLWFFRTFRFPW